jgi:hypothetical protein
VFAKEENIYHKKLSIFIPVELLTAKTTELFQ